MSTSDLALLERWAKGRDAEAFRELAARHAAMVYATCRRILGNAAEAEDVAQECFLTLAQKGARAQVSLGAWLHRVATNRALDRMKGERSRREREARFAEVQAAPAAGATAASDDWAEVRRYVDEAIAALPEAHRELIVAHFLEGQSHAAIAETRGVSRQTVTYTLGKAVESVREALAKKGVAVSAIGFTAALGTEMAEAAPATLTAALGKMALSGGAAAPAAGAAAAVGGALTAGKIAWVLGAVVVVAGAVLVGKDILGSRQPSPATPQTAALAQRGASEDTAAQSDDGRQVSESAKASNSGGPDAESVSGAEADDWRVLTGVVLGLDGQPVDGQAGVSVFAVGTERDGRRGAGRGVGDGGLFRIGEFQPGARGVIWARDEARNLASAMTDFSLTKDGAHHVELALGPAASVSGEFVDADGLRIEGTSVRAECDDYAGLGLASVDVDSTGAFEIGPLPPGPITLRAGEGCKPPQEGPLRIRQQSFDSVRQTITLAPGQRLTRFELVFDKRRDVIAGRVMDEGGRPIEKVVVTAHRDPAAMMQQAGTICADAETDADGRYEIPVFAPGRFIVFASAPGFEHLEPAKAKAGARDVDFVLRKGWPPLEFLVVRADTNEPVKEYAIAVGNSIDEARHRSYCTVKSDEGKYTANVQGPGDVHVFVRVPGYGAAEEVVRRTNGAPSASPIIIRVAPGERIEGVVLSQSGVPVAGALLFEEPPQETLPAIYEQSALAKSDANGAFAVAGLPAATDALWVYHPDFPPLRAPLRAPLHAQVPKRGPWRITFAQGATIEGAVTMGGRPQEAQAIELTANPFPDTMPGVLPRKATTDENGFYRFTGVPAGAVSVKAHFRAGPTSEGFTHVKEATLEIAGEETKEANFDFAESTAGVKGTVYEGATPAKGSVGCMVACEGSQERYGTTHSIETDGSFSFTALMPGEAWLTARLDGADFSRQKELKIQLAANNTAQVPIRFVPGNATLAGQILVDPKVFEGPSFAARVETADGEERIDCPRLDSENSAYRLEGLPAGQARITCKFRTREGIERTRVFDVLLAADAVTPLDIALGNATIRLEILGLAEGEQFYTAAFEGAPALPDFKAISIDEMQHFFNENPPAELRAGGEAILESLQPGAYTVVAMVMGDRVTSGDQVPPNLRYGVATVEATDGAEATASITIR